MSVGRTIFAGLMGLTLAGCYSSGSLSLIPPATTATIHPPKRHVRSATASTHQPVTPSQENATVPPGKEPENEQQVTAPPQGGSVVTLGGQSEASQAGAEELVQSTSTRLYGINRANLDADESPLYDQANNFLSAAKQSLQDKDYAAAAAFARKASTLTARLAPQS